MSRPHPLGGLDATGPDEGEEATQERTQQPACASIWRPHPARRTRASGPDGADDYSDENIFVLGSVFPKVEKITVDAQACKQLANT